MKVSTMQLETLAEAVGVNASELPDRLVSTYLLAIAEKMGVDPENIPDRLHTSIFEKIVEDGQMGGSGGSSGKVLEVATAAQMDAILANATAEDVGRGYLYTGETTEAYESYHVYIIREE